MSTPPLGEPDTIFGDFDARPFKSCQHGVNVAALGGHCVRLHPAKCGGRDPSLGQCVRYGDADLVRRVKNDTTVAEDSPKVVGNKSLKKGE